MTAKTMVPWDCKQTHCSAFPSNGFYLEEIISRHVYYLNSALQFYLLQPEIMLQQTSCVSSDIPFCFNCCELREEMN